MFFCEQSRPSSTTAGPVNANMYNAGRHLQHSPYFEPDRHLVTHVPKAQRDIRNELVPMEACAQKAH
eukprot:1918725-Amphidinium_carterae.2